MYKITATLFLFSLIFQINAQDFDLYKKDKNDNYKMPLIDQQMTVEEFELLSHNVRMKDMLYASIVPGYVHFKIKENKQGYWLLGIRSAAYLSMGGLYISGKSKLFSIDTQNMSDEELSDVNRYQYSFYTALFVATATYVYDVIHGDWVLHQKQERIRYKYAIKASKHPIGFNNNNLYPSLALSIQF
jgi:hypothetical protein